MDLEAAADRARAEHVAAQARVDEANRALRTAAGRKAAADKSTAEAERETKRLQAEAQAKLLELSSLRETARLMDGAAARELQAVERAAASADEKHKWAQRRVLQDEAAMLETLVDMLRAVSDEDASALAAVGEVVFQFAKYELSWEWLAEGGTAKAEEMRSSVAKGSGKTICSDHGMLATICSVDHSTLSWPVSIYLRIGMWLRIILRPASVPNTRNNTTATAPPTKMKVAGSSGQSTQLPLEDE